jgi:ubiquinone/menaquinone biosynthesis C-methylase UbiE
MQTKIYPDSGVELRAVTAKSYDRIMNIGTLGLYKGFIQKVIHDMGIRPDDQILDLGCGTGRNAKLMVNYLNDKGLITGMDISEHMERQFRMKFKNDRRVEYIKQRIDLPFHLQKSYDKIFIGFVIHGFPHEIRGSVIQNAYNHLKHGGMFFILDFAEFDIRKMPPLHRFIFTRIECKYAFDFIKRNWKEILNKYGFDSFTEQVYFKKYVRLLSAQREG